MSTYTKAATTMSGAPRRFGRNTFLATVGGGLILAAAVGAGLWARSGNDASTAPSVEAVTAPPSAASFSRPSYSDVPAARTTYLVGSQEEAELVSVGINDANAIRVSAGESLLLDSVVVVGSDEEAAALAGWISEGNRILASLGLAEDVVMDLRGK